MIDITDIYRIDKWDNLDFVCIKSNREVVSLAMYYLEGHQMLESFLSENDENLIRFAQDLGCYSTAEIMLGENNSYLDQFYIRTIPSTEFQENQLYEYLTQGLEKLNKKARFLYEIYKKIETFTEKSEDYKPLYFCGFVKHQDSKFYDKVRFYFKTFGTEESQRMDQDIIQYLEKWIPICDDDGFKVVRDLVLSDQIGLRSAGIEFDSEENVNFKFYLCPIQGGYRIEELIETLQTYPIFSPQAKNLQSVIKEIDGYYCELIQLSGGSTVADAHLNLYFRPLERRSRMYYSLNQGLVLRDIGGVIFLINIHEKNYYNSKQIFSVNETGKAIIEYFQRNSIGTIEGAVSYLKSLLKNYTPDLYPTIYADCQAFITRLLDKGYIKENI